MRAGPAAEAPPEAGGRGRDDVRLLVARHPGADGLRHAPFADLPDLLRPGDVLVVNTSATRPSALPVRRGNDTPLRLHLSTPGPPGVPLPVGVRADDAWVVEVRRPHGVGSRPFRDALAGERLDLPDGGVARLAGRHRGVRLWLAEVRTPVPLCAYLARHAAPIRYADGPAWPLAAYQTVYATETGSAEMPSAGRPFTPEIVTRLVARGVAVAPIVLHAGVSSLEEDERPFAERFRVPAETARLVNAARAAGGRAIAVGTTVVRALETVADAHGVVDPGEGWTEGPAIGPGRDVRVVDGLLTGWHEPRSSHLRLLERLAGAPLVAASYRAALDAGYRWHEFGDVHLLLPERRPLGPALALNPRRSPAAA